MAWNAFAILGALHHQTPITRFQLSASLDDRFFWGAIKERRVAS